MIHSTRRRRIKALTGVASILFAQKTVYLKTNSTLTTSVRSPKDCSHKCPIRLYMLTPKPLQNQAERLHEAEQAVSEHAQQVQKIKEMHIGTLSKLSEQYDNAVKKVHVDTEYQLRQQQLAHDSIVAHVQAQHVTDVQQIVRKHMVAHTQALDAAKINFEVERTQQQNLHEQALWGHSAELSRQARQYWVKWTGHFRNSMQSLRAQHDSQLRQQQIRLSAEYQADKKVFMLRSGSV